MNADSIEKQPKNRKRFWILTMTLLAALASFLLSIWGFMVGFLSVFGGIITFAIIPIAGDQIMDEMDKNSSWFDSIIVIGLIGDCFFLILFMYLLRKLKH